MSERYKKFYTEYKNKLYSYLISKSGDSEVAQDIMQESFTRHFQYYGHEAVISPTLLFTIARNALVDYQRSQSKFPRADHVVPQTAADEEVSLIAKEESARIHEAIDKLPEQDKEILTLAVGGVAYKEIAAIFELSEANVKVRVHRSRTKIRQMLNK